MIVSWLLFPLVLGSLALGVGALLERASGTRIPGPLLLPAGFAAIVVVAQFTTLLDATAELTTPLVVALALAGLLLSPPWRGRRFDGWAAACAAGAFAVFAAPVVLSGEATFAGYIKLDDTATWFALTDRIMDHGRSLDGLAPSSYEATLAFNLADGYPVGVFGPLGIGHELVRQDVAWVFQPYLTFLAALLALSLYAIVAPLLPQRPLRALAAFVGSQSALLLGYALWGGIKELAVAALLPLVAVLLAEVVRESRAGRALLPLAFAAAAVLGVLSVAGAVWFAPALVGALAAAVILRGAATATRQALVLALATAALCLPLFFGDALIPPTSSPLTSGDAKGNLVEPLSPLQVFGIWPSGDFRLRPDPLGTTRVVIVVELLAALFALILAWRRRAWELAAYVGTAVAGCLAIAALGSPWVDGKALAIASPALVVAGVTGALALAVRGRRVEGILIAAAIAGGVLWSNALAYHDVNLAPRDRLAELERIGERIAGEGPALMTDYEPYGVRHFLRDADAEGASELRRRIVPLRAGGTLDKLAYADVDEFQLDAVLTYRTLVLRRSPVASRPPSAYRLVEVTEHYEVWQRPVAPRARIGEHLSLGRRYGTTARLGCAQARRLATIAGESGMLAVARRPSPIALRLARTDHPASWEPSGPGSLEPASEGTVRALFTARRPALYGVWVGGSFRGHLAIALDGFEAGAARHRLSHAGTFEPLGSAALGPGRHALTLRYGGEDLHPGSGGRPFSLGPVVLADATADRPVSLVRPEDAQRLCGQRLDWIEALTPG